MWALSCILVDIWCSRLPNRLLSRQSVYIGGDLIFLKMFWQSEFPEWISSWQLDLCNCVSPLWYSWPSSTSAKLLTVKAALEIMLLKSMTKCSFLQVTYFQDGSYTPVSQCILRSLTKVDWSRYGLTVKEVQSADCIGGVLQFQEQASFSSMHIILHTYHLYIQQLVNSVVHCMLFAWESVLPYLRVSNWWCRDKNASLNCQHISHSSQTADVHGTCWTCQFCPFIIGFYRMPKTRDWKLTLLGWQQQKEKCGSNKLLLLLAAR